LKSLVQIMTQALLRQKIPDNLLLRYYGYVQQSRPFKDCYKQGSLTIETVYVCVREEYFSILKNLHSLTMTVAPDDLGSAAPSSRKPDGM
jgi:hypothetical protein